MTTDRFFTFYIVLLSVFFISCGSEEVGACATESSINRILDQGDSNVATALNMFLRDQNEVNCNNVRRAYQAQIDELNGILDCAIEIGQGTQVRTAISASTNVISTLPCG